MEVRHHLHPLLQQSFEGKAPHFKTEASSRLRFQELLSNHEFKMESQISTIQNGALQASKKKTKQKTNNNNHKKKPTPKNTPPTNKITIKNSNSPGRCTHILHTSFHPTCKHAHFVTSSRHGVHPTNLDISNSSRDLYPQQQTLLLRHRDTIIKVFKYHMKRIIGIKFTDMCY